jgi:3-deoxy-D-manno-octulosonic-acid transferase
LTVIVPRHPDRGEAIARMIAASGLNPTLRSHEDLPTATTDIYVADTMGELGLFYRLAPPSMRPAARGLPIRRKRW